MAEEKRKDHFFNFLIDQIEDKEAKTVLKLVKEFPSAADTRILIRECLKKLNNNHKDD
ncbi:hypothetical protein H8D83_01390 [Candidatus Woesearchaeota archaeon]|nr:hypothetical protein [Candidatus Woesearchaeota archaeon]